MSAFGRKQSFTWMYTERLVMTLTGHWDLPINHHNICIMRI